MLNVLNINYIHMYEQNIFHVKWIILYYVNFYFDSKEMKLSWRRSAQKA